MFVCFWYIDTIKSVSFLGILQYFYWLLATCSIILSTFRYCSQRTINDFTFLNAPRLANFYLVDKKQKKKKRKKERKVWLSDCWWFCWVTFGVYRDIQCLEVRGVLCMVLCWVLFLFYSVLRLFVCSFFFPYIGCLDQCLIGWLY